ncbi:MAG: thioredoxin-dependent thiol peroxidase [Dehalococcoidia bacterium]|nr:MAG: thioredoxin-dependent thiol peroxidase [Dehalococcoidia bacterium]
MPSVEAGDTAPPFELEDHAGKRVRLDDLRGRWVVLYWYPKDDTPGCTTEACDFRDNWTTVSAEAEVYGVSPDSVKSHEKFREKFQLPFPLLADAGHAAAELYGVWALKKFMGREYMGVERTTFIIGPDGKVARVFRKVKPAGHAGEVLDALAELKG